MWGWDGGGSGPAEQPSSIYHVPPPGMSVVLFRTAVLRLYFQCTTVEGSALGARTASTLRTPMASWRLHHQAVGLCLLANSGNWLLHLIGFPDKAGWRWHTGEEPVLRLFFPDVGVSINLGLTRS